MPRSSIKYSFSQKPEINEALLFKGREQEDLFRAARQTRDRHFEGRVEIRSVIEYSNICDQDCQFCGMCRESSIKRYVLAPKVFSKIVDDLYGNGRRVIMVQTGDNSNDTFFNKLLELLQKANKKYPDIQFIFALGSLSEKKYRRLWDLGNHRYLLKFESSDHALYKQIKPSDTLKNRLHHINLLKEIGFKVSSGNISALPGQSIDSLVEDLLLLKELDLPMGSTSPFIPNEMSRFSSRPIAELNLTLNFMAILRILCPAMLIPSTSALELIAKDGLYKGLMAGANTLTIHDGTPSEKEANFVIYKKERYKPKISELAILDRAGLTGSNQSLIKSSVPHG